MVLGMMLPRVHRNCSPFSEFAVAFPPLVVRLTPLSLPMAAKLESFGLRGWRFSKLAAHVAQLHNVSRIRIVS